jgi:hypothetical protein
MCDWQNCPLNNIIEEKFKGVENKLDSNQAYNAQHFQLNELAIKKAEDSMTVRLENMNEFRAQLVDERSTMVSKTTHNDLEKRMTQLELAAAESKGKASVEDVKKVGDTASNAKLIGIIASAIAIIGTLIGVVIKFIN